MVKATLVEKDIADGARLLKALDEAGIQPKAAMWLFNPESESYRYVLALPRIKEEGTLPVRRAIRPIVDSLSPPVGLPLDGFQLLDARDKMIRGLHKMFRRTHKGRDVNFRLTGTIIDGGFVHDAYVYRA
jgi:hypothetical protein